MKKILLSLFSFFSIYNYSQGCVDRIVCSDDMITLYLLDGNSLTWGRNQYGQLGNNTTTLQNTPVAAAQPVGPPRYCVYASLSRASATG